MTISVERRKLEELFAPLILQPTPPTTLKVAPKVPKVEEAPKEEPAPKVEDMASKDSIVDSYDGDTMVLKPDRDSRYLFHFF